MTLSHMDRDTAKYALRSEWERKTRSYNLSATDGFTDGFWAGRLWAMARILGELGEDYRALLMEKLDVLDNEVKQHGI